MKLIPLLFAPALLVGCAGMTPSNTENVGTAGEVSISPDGTEHWKFNNLADIGGSQSFEVHRGDGTVVKYEAKNVTVESSIEALAEAQKANARVQEQNASIFQTMAPTLLNILKPTP